MIVLFLLPVVHIRVLFRAFPPPQLDGQLSREALCLRIDVVQRIKRHSHQDCFLVTLGLEVFER